MEAVEGNQGNHMAINLLHPNICMYILHTYFCDLKLLFRGDIVRRSEILVTLRVKGLKRVKFLSALLGKGEKVIILNLFRRRLQVLYSALSELIFH